MHQPTADTPNCWTLSLLQHLDEIGMEISLTPTPAIDIPPTKHSITEHLDNITTEQQGLLTAIGKKHIEDLEAPKPSASYLEWTPLSRKSDHTWLTGQQKT